jgi:Fe2+ or Zn2+ uptake regulation protein
MSPSPNSTPSEICQRILRYLQDHPEAADSLEGIASWWLPQSGQVESTEAVQEALALLVAQQRIARIDLADRRTLYQSVDKAAGSHTAPNPPNPRRQS